MTNIQIIDPTQYPDWDELLLTNENTSFFHTSGWAKVLTESYGYKPLYFTRIENDKLVGLLAVMEVHSLLTRKRGVSLPFTDHCPVIAKDKAAFESLFDFAVSFGSKRGWKNLGLRGGVSFLRSEKLDETFLTHELKLVPDENRLLSSFRSSTRRNIKKALKEGITVKAHNTIEVVKAFYLLNCLTRKDHGLPPQPSSFFEYLHDHVISKKKGWIFIAQYDGKPIAGAVFASFGEKAIYKYGASDKAFQTLRANNLLMWEGIRHFSKNGCKTFDFGRTDLEHNGLLQFKRGWGTKEETLHYYNYDLSKKQFVTRYPRIKTSYPIFRNMPIPLLKLVGRVLYRHMA